MSKHEGLSRIAKVLRALGVVWFLLFTGVAAVSAWGNRVDLTREEQIALYERQVGHSIEEDLRKLPVPARKDDPDDAYSRYFGTDAQSEQKTRLLATHFRGETPYQRVHDWNAAALFLVCGLVGLAIGWALGWIVAGFAA